MGSHQLWHPSSCWPISTRHTFNDSVITKWLPAAAARMVSTLRVVSTLKNPATVGDSFLMTRTHKDRLMRWVYIVLFEMALSSSIQSSKVTPLIFWAKLINRAASLSISQRLNAVSVEFWPFLRKSKERELRPQPSGQISNDLSYSIWEGANGQGDKVVSLSALSASLYLPQQLRSK